MKANYKLTILYLIAAIAFSACSAGKQATAQTYDEDGYYDQNDDYYDDGYGSDRSNVDINVFVNALSPYGRWTVSPTYGRVWIANEPGFTPYYTRGHWIYTSYGWTWASDYSWGWAPFHYGRWAYDPFYGWMWVPGYEWGPAWVGWRTGGDFYGWAPLAPGINISVGFSFGNYMPADRWCFVPRRYMASPHFVNYRVAPSRNVTIINNTTIINKTNVYRNTRYVAGPERREVERYSGQRINTIRINNDNKPGNYRVVNKNTVAMYRPEIKKDITINNHSNNGNNSHNNNNVNRGGQANQQRREVEIDRNNNRNYNKPSVPVERKPVERKPVERKYDNTRDIDGTRHIMQQEDFQKKNDDVKRDNDKRQAEIRRKETGNREMNEARNRYADVTRDRTDVTRDRNSVSRDNNRQNVQDWNRTQQRNAEVNRQRSNMSQNQPGMRNERPSAATMNNDRFRSQNNQPNYRQMSPQQQQQTSNSRRRNDK